MATTTCERCGTGFDRDREPTLKGADTPRYPSYGAKYDESRPHADGGETIRVPRDADEAEVTVTFRFQGD